LICFFFLWFRFSSTGSDTSSVTGLWAAEGGAADARRAFPEAALAVRIRAAGGASPLTKFRQAAEGRVAGSQEAEPARTAGNVGVCLPAGVLGGSAAASVVGNALAIVLLAFLWFFPGTDARTTEIAAAATILTDVKAAELIELWWLVSLLLILPLAFSRFRGA
jgi:hypothetical protein